MAFVDYELLSKAYPTGRMQENVRLLKEYDVFHCLLAGSSKRAAVVKKHVAGLPEDYRKWLEVCDGGLLFDTVMLTTKSYDGDLDLVFETYGDLCKAELRNSVNLADEWFVFALAVHADVFFFDIGKKDGLIYQWDVEEELIYANWATFEDWLSDQIKEAVECVVNGIIKPNLVKSEVNWQ